jgi:cytoskeleton protein RodZ
MITIQIPVVEGGSLVGELLKKRREELGQDLRQISDTLKIKYDYLRAIEDGDLTKIPAEVYVKAYIQEYAKALNLDYESIMNAYARQTSQPATERQSPPEKGSIQGKRFKIQYILIPAVLALLVAIIVYVQFPSSQKKPQIPVISVTPPKVDLPKATTTGHDLEVIATDTTWILVMIDKTKSKEMMLKRGDSAKWHATDFFFLKIGNAGGIKIIFDGKNISNLGEKGQVVKINLPEAGT